MTDKYSVVKVSDLTHSVDCTLLKIDSLYSIVDVAIIPPLNDKKLADHLSEWFRHHHINQDELIEGIDQYRSR